MSHDVYSPDRLSFGRLRGNNQFAEIVRTLESALRKSEKVPRSCDLSFLKGERLFLIEAHRPAWGGEWTLDPVSDVEIWHKRPFSRDLAEKWIAFFGGVDRTRRRVMIHWKPRQEALWLADQGWLHVYRDSGDLLRRSDDSTWSYGVQYGHCSPPTGDSPGSESKMRAVVGFWNLASFIESGPTGFRLNVPPSHAEVRAVYRNFADQPEAAVPHWVQIDALKSADVGIDLFNSALRGLQESVGPPELIQFLQRAEPHEMGSALEVSRGLGRTVDRIEFLGRYRKKFDPLTRPENVPTGAVKVFPVLRFGNDDGKGDGTRVYCQVNVIHTSQESFLEVQTTEGNDWLQKVSQYSRCDVDIWSGHYEDRWNLY